MANDNPPRYITSEELLKDSIPDDTFEEVQKEILDEINSKLIDPVRLRMWADACYLRNKIVGAEDL